MRRLLVGVITLAVASFVGCTGPKGDKGDPGGEGAAGAEGPAGQNGQNGQNGDAGPPGPTGPAGDAGTPAVDKASVFGVVTDSLSEGAVANAAVTLQPLGRTARTNAFGEYRFDDVPIAMVKVQVAAARLTVLGNDVVATTQVVAAETPFVPLVAGLATELDVPVARLVGGVNNLDVFHNSAKATTVFKDANCKACHADRAGQLSRVATVKTFHGLPLHSSMGCTAQCHAATIDLVNGANVVVRKPVNAATVCVACHARYPTNFCTAGTPPCP